LKYALYILFILAISYNVFPLALGLNRDRRTPHLVNVFHAIVFGLIQGIMYYIGISLGETFMHLFADNFRLVVFGILGAVSVRMFIEAFKIRKGARLFSFDSYVKFVIMGIAAGINTLIIGMTASYLSPFESLMPLLLVAGGFAWSIAGISMNLTRKNIILSSLLHLISATFIFIFGLLFLVTKNWL
jgi:putative Mn2+ efflux pump MntP